MTTDETLRHFEQIELKMAELYRSLAHRFQHQQILGRLFVKIADEEVIHANQIRFELRMIRSAGLERRDTGYPVDYFRRLTDSIDAFLGRRPLPSLTESIDLASRMEATAAENLHHEIAIAAMPSMAPLFRGLEQGDRAHLALLKNIKQTAANKEVAA